MLHDLDTFTHAYIDTALWASRDESDPETGGEPMDQNYVPEDIHPDTLSRMIEDCRRFQADHYEAFSAEGMCLRCGPDYDESGHAGHDFWLTRNRHGAGFWDGDWHEDVADRLTEAARAFGEYDLYVGDDGMIHGTPA